jgi:hypothetical protein
MSGEGGCRKPVTACEGGCRKPATGCTEVTEKARMMAKRDSVLVKAGAADSKLIERDTVVSTTLEAEVISLGERAKASPRGAAMELE